MNPIIKDQINSLRRPGVTMEGVAHAVASLMEITQGQNEKLDAIEEQTTRTNGRVTKLEELATRTNGRIEVLEAPAGEIRTICKVIGKAGAVAIACVGLVTGTTAMVGGLSKPDPDEIKAIVEQAVKDAKKTP